ncbi:MAG TPA: 4'-phosphopantetheinyl transferase superfamily protein [Syntrophales bacterium]
MDVTQDHHEITVHATSPVHGRGPVFYASMPFAAETLRGYGTNGAGDRHRLVCALWDHLAAMESPLWKHCQSSNRAAFPIQVVRGPLGRPQLVLGEYRGPAISVSKGGGTLWAALCADESDIGIDAAGTDEFTREYPYHRVFHRQELQHALQLAGGDLEKASALLWSVKEAVVKALGCAFHLVDPRQITVCPSAEGAAGENGGVTFPVGLSGKALARFPIAAGRSLWVRSLPRRKMWLSIALFNRQHG